MKHRWTLEIIVREYEWDARNGRWIVVSSRRVAANPEERWR